MIKFILIAAGAIVLYGCAPISQESCLNDSAFDIGRTAAMDNADHDDRAREITKTCGKHGRSVDLGEYSAGFNAGTETFCVPDNGYSWGLRGRSYNGVCNDPTFRAAYDDGHRVYRIKTRRTEIRNELEDIRDRLATIAKTLDEDSSLTEENRRKLLRKEEQLLLKRSDFLAELRRLPDF